VLQGLSAAWYQWTILLLQQGYVMNSFMKLWFVVFLFAFSAVAAQSEAQVSKTYRHGGKDYTLSWTGDFGQSNPFAWDDYGSAGFGIARTSIVEGWMTRPNETFFLYLAAFDFACTTSNYVMHSVGSDQSDLGPYYPAPPGESNRMFLRGSFPSLPQTDLLGGEFLRACIKG
jgi:hypothetical protein